MGCFVFLLDKLSNKGGMVINSILCVSSAYPLQFVFQSTTTYSNSNKSIQFGHQLSLDPCSPELGLESEGDKFLRIKFAGELLTETGESGFSE